MSGSADEAPRQFLPLRHECARRDNPQAKACAVSCRIPRDGKMPGKAPFLDARTCLPEVCLNVRAEMGLGSHFRKARASGGVAR